GRFASFVMDEPYLLAAARYVELNPLRAGLVADPCASAMEQRAGTCGWSGRPVGESGSAVGDDSRLVRLPEKRRAGGGTEGHSPSRAHRSSVGRRLLSRAA